MLSPSGAFSIDPRFSKIPKKPTTLIAPFFFSVESEGLRHLRTLVFPGGQFAEFLTGFPTSPGETRKKRHGIDAIRR
jgi:hypothetical protein